jgi:hypothetical protein
VDAAEIVASTCSLFTWTAGAMMWLGCSPRSWMMYSPRSVSTTSKPGLQFGVQPDLLGDHALALGDRAWRPRRQMSTTCSRASSAVGRPVHLAAGGQHLLLEGSR